MTTALVISNLLLWIIVILLLGLVYALVRQIGVLHERIAPVGALTPEQGPKMGETLPDIALNALDGTPLSLTSNRPTLIYFLSPSCPICKSLLPVVRDVSQDESTRIVFASDGDSIDHHMSYALEQQIDPAVYVLSQPLGLMLGVNKLPFAALITTDGVLRARGLVNSREHIESLLEADEMDVASVQEYLGKTQEDAS